MIEFELVLCLKDSESWNDTEIMDADVADTLHNTTIVALLASKL